MCFAPFGKIDLESLYKTLEILKIDQTYSLEVGKFVFKQKNNLLPVCIAQHFDVRIAPQHGYNLRSNNETRAPILVHRTLLGEKSIQTRGHEEWEKIPEEIKAIVSPIFFKNKLKMYALASDS